MRSIGDVTNVSCVCFFSVLRKQARKLENEIDIKLVAYSKVGSSPVPTTSVDTAPLLGEHIFDSLSMEIEQMLDKVGFRLLPLLCVSSHERA